MMASKNTDQAHERIEPGQADQPAATAARAAKRLTKRNRLRAETGQLPTTISKASLSKTPNTSKTVTLIKMLRGARGATITAMTEATGCQAHSVRGFLSGTVKKKMALVVTSEAGKDGVRRYRIVQDTTKAG